MFYPGKLTNVPSEQTETKSLYEITQDNTTDNNEISYYDIQNTSYQEPKV